LGTPVLLGDVVGATVVVGAAVVVVLAAVLVGFVVVGGGVVVDVVVVVAGTSDDVVALGVVRPPGHGVPDVAAVVSAGATTVDGTVTLVA
jgi:hypothetical protein